MADPLTAFFAWLGTSIGGATGAFLVMNAVGLAYTALIAGSIALGNAQARKAEREATNKYNETLQDRAVMIRTSSAPSPWAVGLSKLSGPVVFAHTTGTYNEYLHLVIALARHECDAIEAIYFNETELPPENGSTGMVESGDYAVTSTEHFVEVVASNGSGVATLSRTATSIYSVSSDAGLDSAPLVSYSHSPPSATITGLPASSSVVVTYTAVQVASYVRIKKHLGAPGQVADADLIAESGGAWTSSDKGTSVCYIYVRLLYSQDIFGQIGIPNISARVRGKKLYDPRTGLTVYSTNAALATAAYLKDPVFGIRSATGEVIDSELITAANICDEDVTMFNNGTVSVTNGSDAVGFSDDAGAKSRVRAGMILVVGANRRKIVRMQSVLGVTTAFLESNYPGSTNAAATFTIVQIRYTANGTLSTANTPWDNLEELSKTMAGSTVWCQGRWLLRAGAYEVPSLTINEDSLTGATIEILPRKGRKDLFNGVKGMFNHAAKGFISDAYPAYTSTAYETEDGERILLPVNYDLVNDPTACQRMGKILLLQSRQALTVKLTCNLKAYNLTPMGPVAITLARYGWSSKVFIVVSRDYNIDDHTLEYILQETSSTVWDWLYVEQANVDPAPNTTLPNPTARPSKPTGLVLTAGTAELMRLSDGSLISRIKVDWIQHPEIFVRAGGRIEIRWKLSNATVWSSSTSVPGDTTSTYIMNAPEGRNVNVNIRAVSANSKVSEWVPGTVFVSGKSAPPGNVVGLTATPRTDGIRITWTRNSELDYKATEIRVGASWGAGVSIFFGNANAFNWLNIPFGAYTFWAVHWDTSDNDSTTPQSAIATYVNQADIALVTHGTGTLEVAGQTVTKTSVNGWDAGVYSTSPIVGGCKASWRIPENSGFTAIVGLNTDPATDASYTSIDYGIYTNNTGNVHVFENGTDLGALDTYADGDSFSIEYDEVAIRYYHGATLLRHVGVQPGKAFYLDSSFFTNGSKITNLQFRPLSAAPRGNMIDPRSWVIGTNGTQGIRGGSLFTEYGTGENTIALDIAPDGSLRSIWRATSGDVAASDADGGFSTGRVPIDLTQPYRWVVFIRPNGSMTGSYGLSANGGGAYADIATGATSTSPMISRSRSELVSGRHYMLVGCIWPSTIGTTPPSPTVSAVYDVVTGQRVASGTDFKWTSTSVESCLFAFQSNAGVGAIQDFYGPRLEMCDGNEPSIDALLAMAKTGLTNNLQPDFESQYALNGHFTNWLLGATTPVGWLNVTATSSRETTITRTGPNAMRLVSPGAANAYNYRTLDFGLPLLQGSFIEGTIDAYLDSHTSGGYPCLMVRCYTDAGLTTQRDTVFDLPNTTVDEWQTVTFKATVNASERIYGVRFYLMASYSLASGGQGVNDIIFDALIAKASYPITKSILHADLAADLDGKIESYFQASAPVGASTGDLWFDSDDGNKAYRWSGAAWVLAQDTGVPAAISAAATAQSTADGKIVTFIQTTAPAAEGAGDLWFDSNDGYKPYRATAPGTGSWVAYQYGDAAISDLSADKINVGTLRGINVNASSHTTRGSFLTTAPAAGATTLNLHNTTDFPSSGSAMIFSATNDRDTVTYTGKTATTLTGCSGVLASHIIGDTIIPLNQKSMTIDDATNEMRFFGDRGDGVQEELASIGIKSSGGDVVIGYFGSANSDRLAVYGQSDTTTAINGDSNSGIAVRGFSDNGVGVYGESTTNYGVDGYSPNHHGVRGRSAGDTEAGVYGQGLDTGPGVYGISSTGNGGHFLGNATKAPIRLEFSYTTAPTNLTALQLAFIRNPTSLKFHLCFSDGSNWRIVGAFAGGATEALWNDASGAY